MGRNKLQLYYKHGNKSGRVQMICSARDKVVSQLWCKVAQGKLCVTNRLSEISRLRGSVHQMQER